jgi:hypothetical protein
MVQLDYQMTEAKEMKFQEVCIDSLDEMLQSIKRRLPKAPLKA